MPRVKITDRGGKQGRGFHQYGEPFLDTYDAILDVYESSAASGPHVWLSIEKGTVDAAQGAVAHLNPKQAEQLIDRLQAWIDEIPSRWNR